ncbi:nitrate assimilation regulatory nira [Fusarium globosum]|uniref:Nitrate assimilation regulatory nira n=1 Tax=Fusarium globosum TaxID=78864 RepID=A0A8H5XP13_9HYPO|nr:nitrate assimilation regulatory nira [Fusarium globosum]
MAQSAAPLTNPMYELSAIVNFDTMLHPAWEQCWAINQPNFTSLSKAAGSDAQNDYKVKDFLSNYTYTPSPAQTPNSFEYGNIMLARFLAPLASLALNTLETITSPHAPDSKVSSIELGDIGPRAARTTLFITQKGLSD